VVAEASDEGPRLLIVGDVLYCAIIGEHELEFADDSGGAFSGMEDGRFRGGSFESGSHR
jgi:hypothetical protein